MELDAKKIAAGGSIVALLGGASQVDRFVVSEDELRENCTAKIERMEDRFEHHLEVAMRNLKFRNDERRRQRDLYGPATEDPGADGGQE